MSLVLHISINKEYKYTRKLKIKDCCGGIL